MRRLALPVLAAFAFALLATAAMPFQGDMQSWTLCVNDDGSAGGAPTLPESPQYYVAAAIDFDVGGVVDGEKIGATHNVCPSADSVTTDCMVQATVANRGTWRPASTCRGDLPCWQYDTDDFIKTNVSTSFHWMAMEPMVCHVGMSLDATPTGVLVGVFSNRSTSGAGRGLYGLLDTRSGARNILSNISGTTSTTASGPCISGVDETQPHIYTVSLTGLGVGGYTIAVDGVTCATSTATDYSLAAGVGLASPYVTGSLTEPGEYAFIWCDTETSAGDVAAMSSRADTALTFLAAAYGVTLP